MLPALLFGQEELSKQFEKLAQLTDPNQKRFTLLELNDAIEAYWMDNDISTYAATNDYLFFGESENKQVSVLTFGAKTYQGLYQLEWLVKYQDKIYSFSEEFKQNNEHQQTYQPEVLQQEDLYKLVIKSGKNTLFSVTDLITKCKFEEFQDLQTNAGKDSLNQIIQKRLNRLWNDSDMYEDDFQQLKRMRTLLSDDGKVKICTYNIQRESFEQKFYGAVIVKDNNVIVHPLTDTSDKIRSPERSSLTNKKWYGALYIDLIQKATGGKTYYTLIGYKGHDEFMKTRVLDVLQIQNNRPRFGAPIFKNDRVSRQRVVFKYSARATMMLRYDPALKMIVMDNLGPTDPMFRGVYEYYGPDFSYNGYKFTKGVWELQKDIDLRNPKQH